MVSDGLLATRFKLVRLDDLEVVEPQLVSGRRDEMLVGRMGGAHQHGLDPLVLDRPLSQVDADLVEPLLIEEDRPARAENLQLDAALAAPGGAADLDRARRAAVHAQ